MSIVDISIIIPIYNVEQYLRECLDSILAQTFHNFEIICVNDGSTDASVEILDEYLKKDGRIKIFHQKNSGAGMARNFGLRKAEGKYILFLDSDDYFEPDLLQELYLRAQKLDADLVVCSSRKVDENGNIIEVQNPNMPINLSLTPMEKPFNRRDFLYDIFNLLTPVPWNKLIKRSLLKEYNIEFPSLRIYEDICFSHCLVVCANRIVVFNKELINYRFNRIGSHAEKRSKHTIDMVKSCLYLKDFLLRKNLFKELKVAYKKAFINHLRSEISFCNNEEYQQFITEFEALLPNEWKMYDEGLRNDFITSEYLESFIGNKKVLLWGASLFIRRILENETKKISNILGIIDNNRALWNQNVGNYKIYSPDSISTLNPDCILLTVLSNNELIYDSLKQDLKQNYPKIELLPNIFEKNRS